MSRPSDWSIIENGWSDPVPGESVSIRELADRLSGRRRTLQCLADDLNAISKDMGSSGSVFVGEAADKFKAKMGDFPKEMGKLASSFDNPVRALRSWADTVSHCQGRADDALARAWEAKRKLDGAQGSCEQASVNYQALDQSYTTAYREYAIGESDRTQADLARMRSRRDEAQRQFDMFRNQLSSAQNELDQARADAKKAAGDYEQAAKDTARTIEGSFPDMPGTSLWEQVYYSQAWEIVVKAAEIGAFVAGILSLFCGGWLVSLIALVCAALLFVNSTMARAAKDISWDEFALSFLVLSLSFVGAGKALEGMKTAVAASKSGSVFAKSAALSDAVGLGRASGGAGSGMELSSTLKGIKESDAARFAGSLPRHSGDYLALAKGRSVPWPGSPADRLSVLKRYNRFVHVQDAVQSVKDLPRNLAVSNDVATLVKQGVKAKGGQAARGVVKNVADACRSWVHDIEAPKENMSSSTVRKNVLKSIGVVVPGAGKVASLMGLVG